jgi:hypothetical protein
MSCVEYVMILFLLFGLEHFGNKEDDLLSDIHIVPN